MFLFNVEKDLTVFVSFWKERNEKKKLKEKKPLSNKGQCIFIREIDTHNQVNNVWKVDLRTL